MKWSWVVLFILIFTVPALAGVSDQTPHDSRLDTKVTLDVRNVELQDVLKDLSKQTSVELVAGSTSRDWRVRERKVSIFAKDVPLGTILDEISELLSFLATRSGEEGKWKYRIWQDKKRRDLEAALLVADKEAIAENARELTQLTIEDAKKALDLSPEKALKLRKDDPWTAFLGGTDSGRAYAKLLMYLNDKYPTERELILRGRPVNIDLASAPPEIRQIATDVLRGDSMVSMYAPTSDNAVADMITVSPVGGIGGMGGMASEALSAGFGAMVTVSGKVPGGFGEGDDESAPGGGLAMYPFTHSDSPIAKWMANISLTIMDRKAQGKDVSVKSMSEILNESGPMDDCIGKSPTEQNPPTDPSLTREVELGKVNIKNSGMESNDDSVKVISKAIDRPVMLECFDQCELVGRCIKPGKQPLYKILIALENGGYTWAYDGTALRIRPHDWALKRSYEVSKSFIQYYVGLLEKRGELTLDNLAEIASSLTDEQLGNLFNKWPKKYSFVFLSELDAENIDILRLYADLNSNQKALLKEDSGLPFAQLNTAQMQRVSEITTDKFGGVYVVDGSISIKPAPQGFNPGQVTFEFVVQTDESEQPKSFERDVTIMDKESIAETMKIMEKPEAEEKDKEEKSADSPASDTEK